MNRFFNTGTGFNPYSRPTIAHPLSGPNYYYTPPATQPIQPTFNQQQTIIPNQTNIIWVDNESQIASYPTGRGWQQWFGDKNDQILYIRDTDSNGITQPVVKVRYEVIEQAPVQNNTDTVASAQNSANVGPSREEFDKLSASVNMLIDKLGDLLK